MTKCQEAFEKEYFRDNYYNAWFLAYRAGMERAAEIVWECRETPFDPYEAVRKEMEE